MSTKEKLLASAQKFIAKGQFPRAIKDYEKLVELDPKDIRTRQKLAELYSRAGMTAQALETFEGIARHFADNGFFLKAIAVYKQMQRLEPGRVFFWLRLAELNQKQGLIGNAQAEYRALVDHYEKDGQFQDALKILQKMKDLEPENLNIRVKIAETCLQAKASDKARAEILEAVALLESKQDHLRLLKIYERFLPQFPTDTQMRTGQARALLAQGEDAQAIAILEALVTEYPQDSTLMHLLAEAFRHQGNHAGEVVTYRRLLERFPENEEARSGLVRALLDSGEYSPALDELEACRDAFLRTGRFEILKTSYERLKKELPADERIRRSLLVIYQATGEGDKLFEAISDSSEGGLEELLAPAAPKTPPAPKARPEAASAEVSDGAEEIPLEFLESLNEAEPALQAAAPTEAVLSAFETEPEPQKPALLAVSASLPPEMEPALELDLEFDFSLEPKPAASEALTQGEEEGYPGEAEGAALEAAGTGWDFFDLRSAVLEETEAELAAAEKPAPKKGIKTDVHVEDPESHYNLGIAYKEMGLLDDAVSEFDKAMSEPSLVVACLTLKGICLTAKGAYARAEAAFRHALGDPALDEEGRKGLLYELGLLYEAWGRPADAVESYRSVAALDPLFRNVGEKIEALRSGAEAPFPPTGDPGRKNRVSYV